MKAKDLKEILNKIDDDMDVAIHINYNESDADEFLTIVNDVTNNRIQLSFINKKHLI